jgi:mono/diheme cytochrome c family protein
MRRLLLVVATTIACGREALPPEAARAEAQKIWKERCVTCHGPDGRGDGPGAKILPVRPRNFGDGHWKDDTSDERIAQVIVDGGRSVGLDSNMAANPDLKNKPEVVAALVELVRGL